MLIEVEHGDEVCVLRLSGHFRSGEDPDYLRDKLDEIKSHDCDKMLVDLRELQSIGSMGIGFVVGVMFVSASEPVDVTCWWEPTSSSVRSSISRT